MSKTIVPFAVPMAYVATGVRDIKCGWPILFSAAQRLSEVHVVIGAAGDGLVLAVGATGLGDRGAEDFLIRLASDRFKEKVSWTWTGATERLLPGVVVWWPPPAKKSPRRIGLPVTWTRG